MTTLGLQAYIRLSIAQKIMIEKEASPFCIINWVQEGDMAAPKQAGMASQSEAVNLCHLSNLVLSSSALPALLIYFIKVPNNISRAN